MSQIQVFPAPTRLVLTGGSLPKPGGLMLVGDEAVARAFESRGTLRAGLLDFAQAGGAPNLPLTVQLDGALGGECYTLEISAGGIRLVCGGAAGAFYGIGSLRQVYEQSGGDLPCLLVEDSPALPLRGILLDIGRNKIPRQETLLALIDRFAAMKINHVQLYMDGYCFEWERWKYLFTDETPVTATELRALVAYAAARFIDLVPNVNCLGHMEHWLAKPQLRRFAECEDGFDFQGLYHRAPGTIDPQDPQAVAFVQDLCDELTACFDSPYINVNLDEPFELGQGKSKALAAAQGEHTAYLRHVNAMHEYCTTKQKRMMMWGDVLVKSPESIAQLPDDVTLLHWMYEGDGHFAPEAQALAESGLDFVLCPGTSCWCSFTGRSDRMKRNIADAVDCAVRYGAKGVLLTDWGDLGHWQYISASYVPFAIGAALSWAADRQPEEEIFAYCDRALFGDATGRAARIFYEMGNYYKYENAPLFSTTLCCGVMTSKHRFSSREDFPASVALLLTLSRNLAAGMDIPVPDPDIHLDAEGLRTFLQGLMEQAKALELAAHDGELIKAEMLNACRFVLHGLTLYTAMTSCGSDTLFAAEMAALFEDMDSLMRTHHTLWSARNRTGGFSKSTDQLLHLMRVYDKYR